LAVHGAVAQLGERLAGSQKVRGSSPLGSIVIVGAGRAPAPPPTPPKKPPRPDESDYFPTIVIVRRTSAVVAVFAVTVTR
jgi:hypothetical protein